MFKSHTWQHMERSCQLCMMQKARTGLVISICMRSISATSLVIALTDQNAIFGNVCKIQQKCQLTRQQGQEYKLPHSVKKQGEKKSELQWNVNINLCTKYTLPPPTAWHLHWTVLSANLLPERLDLHCTGKFMSFTHCTD